MDSIYRRLKLNNTKRKQSMTLKTTPKQVVYHSVNAIDAIDAIDDYISVYIQY